MDGLFNYASKFNSDLSSWDVSNVTNMDLMFRNSSFNSNIGNWDVSKVTSMRYMFEYTGLFNGDLSGWNIENVETMEDMFDYSGISTENYDAILIGWSEQEVKSNVELGARGIHYCLSDIERQKLIDDHGWVITDDGQNCDISDVNEVQIPKIHISPNPTTEYINILNNGAYNYQLLNNIGIVISKFESTTYDQTIVLDMQSFNSGMYYLQKCKGNNCVSEKIFKL